MSTTLSKDNQFQLKCPKGRIAIDVCINQQCEHNAFCCKQINCCQQIIKSKCKLMKGQDLIRIYQTSCNRLDMMYNSTIQFFNNIIKMVENQLNNFQQWSERSFSIRKIFMRNQEAITAEELSKILQDNKEYNDQYIEDIAAYLKSWDKNLREQFAEMRTILCQKTRKKSGAQTKVISKHSTLNQQINKSFTLTTRIVWRENQKDALFDVLNYLKNVQSVNLLYHAASNDFSVSKFHEQCDDIPNTLVIIRNDREKVYGGFTPMPWGKSKFEKYIADDDLKTFVFSLTHKKKYLLRQKQKNYAIQWNNLFGPLFGRCNMIQVWDKANKQSTYWQHLPFSFKPLHGQWTNQMYQQMMGIGKHQNFKLLDWEVFEVIFH